MSSQTIPTGQSSGNAPVEQRPSRSQVPVHERDITLLYRPDGGAIIADLIFVHGLQGHPRRTWQYPKTGDRPQKGVLKKVAGVLRGKSPIQGPTQPTVFWPADFLPEDFRNVRILTYGYDSQVSHYFSGPANRLNLSQHGEALLNRVSGERENSHSTGRPIIFIAHSLGGLLVKESLIESQKQRHNPAKLDIFRSTKAIVFFGTPHKGSLDASWGKLLASIVSVAANVNKTLLQSLDPDSEKLNNLAKDFQDMLDSGNLKVCSLLESSGKIGLPVFNGKVVPDWSASFGSRLYESCDYLDGNHMEMCRFPDRDSGSYARFKTGLAFCIRAIGEGTPSNIVPIPSTAREGEVEDRETRGLEQRRLPETRSTEPERGGKVEAGAAELAGQALLSSLRFDDMTSRETQIDEVEAHESTFEWLWVSTNPFFGWLQNLKPLFWIQGKPGSGKSTLMNHIKGHERSKALLSISNGQSHQSWKIIYFFFDFRARGETSNNFNGLLRALIYQLAQSIPELRPVLEEIGSGKHLPNTLFDWTPKRLRRALLEGLEKCTNNICILVDGLDEYEGDIHDLLNMIRLFKDIATKSTSRRLIKLCLASRPEPIFLLAFRDTDGLKMQDYNYDGINKYVFWRFETVALNTNSNPNLDLRNFALSESVSTRSDGVFLWAKFAVDELIEGIAGGEDSRQLEVRLSNIPPDLEDLYSRILRRVKAKHGADFKETSVLIQLTCWAQRTLRLRELFAAFTFEMQGAQFSELNMYTASLEDFYNKINARTGGFLEMVEVWRDSESRGIRYPALVAMEARSKILQKADWLSLERKSTGTLISWEKDFEVRLIHKTVATYFSRPKLREELRIADEPAPLPHALILKTCSRYVSRLADADPTLKFYQDSIVLLTAKLRQAEKEDMARTDYSPYLLNKYFGKSKAEIASILHLNRYRLYCLNRLYRFAHYASSHIFAHASEFEIVNQKSSYHILSRPISVRMVDLHNFTAAGGFFQNCHRCKRMTRSLNWVRHVYLGSSMSVLGALIYHGIHLHVKDAVQAAGRDVNEKGGQPLFYAMALLEEYRMPSWNPWRNPWSSGSFLRRMNMGTGQFDGPTDWYSEDKSFDLLCFLLDHGATVNARHVMWAHRRCKKQVHEALRKRWFEQRSSPLVECWRNAVNDTKDVYDEAE
ncbi:hypothetical protein MMC11_003549 [Xylographa trunciseda]|nr:hypothetical protein [Xylographa trunciseda]